MICKFVVQEVRRSEIEPDGDIVTVWIGSGEDTVQMVFPTPELDRMIATLNDARDAARRMGVPDSGAVEGRLPQTFAVGAVPEAPGFVLLQFDRSLPSRVAFMLNGTTAMKIGKEMIAAGREAQGQQTIAMIRKNAGAADNVAT